MTNVIERARKVVHVLQNNFNGKNVIEYNTTKNKNPTEINLLGTLFFFLFLLRKRSSSSTILVV